MEEEINIERFRKEDYLSKEITQLINQLTEDSKAEWGVMTPQHMLEHLEGAFMISNGKQEVKEVRYGPEVVSKRKAFLMTDEPFGKNIMIGKSIKLRDLKYRSLEEAKVGFFKNLIDFFGYYDKNKSAVVLHPAFGLLNYEEWLQFHYKHVKHHFKQFDLVGEE